jgi:hypothetical protein
MCGFVVYFSIDDFISSERDEVTYIGFALHLHNAPTC